MIIGATSTLSTFQSSATFLVIATPKKSAEVCVGAMSTLAWLVEHSGEAELQRSCQRTIKERLDMRIRMCVGMRMGERTGIIWTCVQTCV